MIDTLLERLIPYPNGYVPFKEEHSIKRKRREWKCRIQGAFVGACVGASICLAWGEFQTRQADAWIRSTSWERHREERQDRTLRDAFIWDQVAHDKERRKK